MRPSLAQLGLALAALGAGSSALAQEADLPREAAEADRIAKDLTLVDQRLQVVEKQYSERREPGEEEALKHRFSDAEIQFLLNNYPQASVLLYDLIGSPAFRAMAQYPEALYLLAESLYQEQNYLGSRLYFREHMNLRGSHYRDSLARYLEISGRVNEFSGIEEYIDKAKGAGGALPADVAYVYGKWLFRRTDLSERDRIARAREAFESVAAAKTGLSSQATYFLGVLAVQEGRLPEAAAAFEQVAKLDASRDKKVRELANLSLGRVYYELGKFTEAIDRYQEIDYQSDYFVEALYEIAWTHVRKARTDGSAEYEKAHQACEKLLLAAPESVLAPEARILQGHLQLKLGKYQDATDSYSQIINTYLQVYDDIDGRLKAQADPVQYFQRLIAESGKAFDVSALMPPIAAKWATTQRDVADAVRMTSDIDASTKGIAASNEIAARLLDVLDKRELELFPAFQEGLARAEAVDSALAKDEGELLQVERRVLGTQRLASLETQLASVRAQRAALEERFKSLPKTESDIEARRSKMAEKLNAVDQQAFRLGYQVEGLFAVLAALDKWVVDTSGQRHDDAQVEKEFVERMRQEREVADQLREELTALQKQMRDDKAKLSLTGTGDAALRGQYQGLLSEERVLLAVGRSGLAEPSQAILRNVDRSRSAIDDLKRRSSNAKKLMRESVRRKGDAIKEKVLAETGRLKDYDGEVAKVSGNARDLVGTIAFESFKRVRRQFYDLVLKADVGLVDVAWTRKQDKTTQIQNLAKQKEKEVKGLEEDFKEVRKEIE
jgi:tetratricopeptide (TPR) repeat protein